MYVQLQVPSEEVEANVFVLFIHGENCGKAFSNFPSPHGLLNVCHLLFMYIYVHVYAEDSLAVVEIRFYGCSVKCPSTPELVRSC